MVYEEPTFGGISCTDCLAHADEYHEHFLGDGPVVDVKLVERIESHLKLCLCCRAKFHQAYPDIPQNQFAEVGPWFRLGLPMFAVALLPVGF